MNTKHARHIRLGINAARHSMRWDATVRVPGIDARRGIGVASVHRNWGSLPALSQRAAVCYIRQRAYPELWRMSEHPELFGLRGVR